MKLEVLPPAPPWIPELESRLSLGQDRPPTLPESSAAVALILHPLSEASLGLVWIQRAANPKDPWSGHMAFPGGRRDPEDSNTLATAIRETREETGLDLEAGTYLGHLRWLRARNRFGARGFKVEPHVFWIDELPDFTPDPSEVSAVHCLSLGTLTDPQRRSRLRVESPQGTWSFPCIDWKGRRIWGLSFRMLEDLLRRLGTLPQSPIRSS